MLWGQSQRCFTENFEMATTARTRTLEMKSKVEELQRVLQKGEKELRITDAKIQKLKAEQVSLKEQQASLKVRVASWRHPLPACPFFCLYHSVEPLLFPSRSSLWCRSFRTPFLPF